MKKVTRLSASQISRFAHDQGGCHSLWWWEKVAGLKEPPSDPMLRGIVGHSIFEFYLLNNKMPTLELVTEWCKKEPNLTTSPAAILRACTCAIHRLPEPRTVKSEQVERGYVLQTPELALPVIGFLDLDFPDEKCILDYKFRSALKWARTPEQLRSDVAANLYALAFGHIIDHPDGPKTKDFRGSMSHIVQPSFNHTIRFEHLTIEMSAGRNDTAITGYDFTPDDLKAFYWDFLVPVVAEMAEAAQKTSAADVGCNFDSCYKYGRTCFFYTNCIQAGNIKPADSTENVGLFGTKRSEPMSGLLAQLMQTQKKMAAERAAPEPAEPEAENTGPSPEERDAIREVVKTGSTSIEAPAVVQDNELTPAAEEVLDEVMNNLEDNVVVNIVCGSAFTAHDKVRESILPLFDKPERLRVEINSSAPKRVFEAVATVCAQNKVPLEEVDDPTMSGIDYVAGSSQHLVVEFPHDFGRFLVDPLCDRWDFTDVDAPEREEELPEVQEARTKQPRLPDGTPLRGLKVDELSEQIAFFKPFLTNDEEEYVLMEGPLAQTDKPTKDTLIAALELILGLLYAKDKQWRHLNLPEPPTQFTQLLSRMKNTDDSGLLVTEPEPVVNEGITHYADEETLKRMRDLEQTVQTYEQARDEAVSLSESLKRTIAEQKQAMDTLMQQPKEEQPRKRMLLLGCTDLKGLEGKVTDARELIEPFLKEAAFECGLGHYLLIDFAKGGSIAAAKLDAAIHNGKIVLPQILAYVYRDDVFDKIVPILRKHYDIVIGAVRG